ncbi:MAG: hypothetical protein ACOCQD_00055 [archaeon]
MEMNRLIENIIANKRNDVEKNFNRFTKRMLWPSDIKEFTAASGGDDATLGNHTFTVEAGNGENQLSQTLGSNEHIIIEGFYLPDDADYNIDYVEVDIGSATNRIWIGDYFQNDDDGFVYVQDPLYVPPDETVKIKFYSDSTATVTIQVLGMHYRTR